MDVLAYRRIVLGGRDNYEPVLKPFHYNCIVCQQMIQNANCFILNDSNMCIGWNILDRMYPVFQSTRHKRQLHIMNTGLQKEIKKRKKRKRRLIYSIFVNITILPTDVIQLITKHI